MAKTNHPDHYEEVLESWRQQSLTWDWESRFEELGLPGFTQEGPIPVTSYGIRYEWSRETGRLSEAGNPDKKLSFSTQMNLYNLISRGHKKPRLSGEWIPLREVKRAYPFAAAFQNQTLAPFARFFDGRADALEKAGLTLGFRKIPDSEVGFEAMAFPCLPIRFLFWDGDDEFPAQANILFDSNITDFVHEETVVMLGQEGATRLMETAGRAQTG